MFKKWSSARPDKPEVMTIHRAFVENNINEVVIKQRRGQAGKWLPSLEPAAVRLRPRRLDPDNL